MAYWAEISPHLRTLDGIDMCSEAEEQDVVAIPLFFVHDGHCRSHAHAAVWSSR